MCEPKICCSDHVLFFEVKTRQASTQEPIAALFGSRNTQGQWDLSATMKEICDVHCRPSSRRLWGCFSLFCSFILSIISHICADSYQFSGCITVNLLPMKPTENCTVSVSHAVSRYLCLWRINILDCHFLGLIAGRMLPDTFGSSDSFLSIFWHKIGQSVHISQIWCNCIWMHVCFGSLRMCSITMRNASASSSWLALKKNELFCHLRCAL